MPLIADPAQIKELLKFWKVSSYRMQVFLGFGEGTRAFRISSEVIRGVVRKRT